MEIVNYEQLIGKVVVITFNDKKYNGEIIQADTHLLLEIDMANYFEEWLKIDPSIPTLPGYLVCNKQKVTFINCEFCGRSSHSIPSNNTTPTYLKLRFSLDWIVLGTELNGVNSKEIDNICVEFKNDSEFFPESLHAYDWEKQIINLFAKTLSFNVSNNVYNIEVNNSLNSDENRLELQKEIVYSVHFDKPITLQESIKRIYQLKGLLMFLLKKNIIINDKYIRTKDYSIIRIFDTFQNNNFENKAIIDSLKHRTITFTDIDNFEAVLNSYISFWDKLYPFIELYHQTTSSNCSNLIKFLNSMSMVEYYSRTFDLQNNSTCLFDRIKSLIVNVNSILGYSQQEISGITKKIKSGRNFYIHYDNRNLELDYNQLFHYAYFIEDIILLNIYQLLGIDIAKIEKRKLIYCFYEKKDLL